MTDPFSEKLDAWRDYVQSPWGRIRYAVVEEVLRRETARLGTGLRILDIGGGDGLDSLPLALAGHDVTIVDQSASWLAEAQRRADDAGVRIATVEGDLADRPALGAFDLVLCHFVLHYRPAEANDLDYVATLVRPGGVLSVMVPNPVAMVLRQLVSAGPAAASTELVTDVKHAVTFDHDVRKIPMADLEQALAVSGFDVARRYGSRIANDLLVDNEPKFDDDYFADLLRLEMSLCDQEPYVRMGGMYQLVATRVS